MDNPQAMNPSSRFRELATKINKLNIIIGVDILAPILQFNYRTWISIFVIVSYSVFTIYSIIKNAGDWQESLRASSMFGGVIHGLAKFLTCLLKQKDMRSLTLFARSIYEDYEKRGISYRKVLNANIDRLLGFIRIIRNGYFVTFSIMTFLPLAMLTYDGTRITSLHYEIPGLPLNTNLGFAVTYLIQLISIVIAGATTFAGDLFVILGLAQIIAFADLMQLKIDELNEALEQKAESRALLAVGAQIEGDENRLHLLLEVIKWHQLFTSYCQRVYGIYYEQIGTQVIAMALSMMISFCVNLAGFNLSLAVFFVVAAYSMAIYCFIGTILEFAFDQVYESICNVAWYELSVDQRKLFGVMLREAQHPHTIQILGVMSLSLNTALQIAKLMYSVSMMVMNRS